MHIYIYIYVSLSVSPDGASFHERKLLRLRILGASSKQGISFNSVGLEGPKAARGHCKPSFQASFNTLWIMVVHVAEQLKKLSTDGSRTFASDFLDKASLQTLLLILRNRAPFA